MDLVGKTALVTGSGTGIGRGIALALSAQGAQVVLCGRTLWRLEVVRAEIEQRGGRALVVGCDVAVASELTDLVQCVIDAFQTIDILVNNAGTVPRGTLLECDEDEMQRAWIVGPVAALRLMRLCHPYLRGGGSVINVSSGSAVQPFARERGIYAAVKAAINALSRAAANEWGPDGIRVNVVMPWARTDNVDRLFREEPDYAASLLKAVPLRRIGDAELDIGRAVAFLASPAAGYLTGAILPLDGGMAFVR